MLHRAPVPAFGCVQVSVVDGWKVCVLPFSVVVEEGWNGKCSRNEVSLYPLPTTLLKCSTVIRNHVLVPPPLILSFHRLNVLVKSLPLFITVVATITRKIIQVTANNEF